ncbi:hypothetical protein [Gordonia sp. (in: high G+C Gram-positive bacteria)]|uniref:hypothetical protein n=1 Tax=Gordonia sp. (in: high G+C Gram-positive bacteria) TaxID=84139 RepID=UPI003F9AF2C5
MSSEDSEIENTAGDEGRETEKETVDVGDTADDTADRAGAATSGVAAKAKARAQARADEQESAQGKQFTVSARALTRAAAAVVVIAVLVVLGFCGWKWYDTQQELNAFDDSKAAASEYVTQYFGVLLKDGASADQLKAKVGPLSTGAQKKQIETSASETVKWRDTQKLANVTTKINSSMVESFSTDHAVTVVSFEFTGTSATAPGGGHAVTLIQLTLDKVDGDWLVSNVQAVPGMAGESASTGDPNAQTGPVPAIPTQPAG